MQHGSVGVGFAGHYHYLGPVLVDGLPGGSPGGG